MSDRSFNALREGRNPVTDPQSVEKKALKRIGESSDGQKLIDYLQRTIEAPAINLETNALIGNEARRQFAAELKRLMETDHAPKPPGKTS